MGKIKNSVFAITLNSTQRFLVHFSRDVILRALPRGAGRRVLRSSPFLSTFPCHALLPLVAGYIMARSETAEREGNAEIGSDHFLISTQKMRTTENEHGERQRTRASAETAVARFETGVRQVIARGQRARAKDGASAGGGPKGPASENATLIIYYERQVNKELHLNSDICGSLAVHFPTRNE